MKLLIDGWLRAWRIWHWLLCAAAPPNRTRDKSHDALAAAFREPRASRRRRREDDRRKSREVLALLGSNPACT
jgi:hypothetical protein